jgi:hypothetical protein
MKVLNRLKFVRNAVQEEIISKKFEEVCRSARLPGQEVWTGRQPGLTTVLERGLQWVLPHLKK